jgi:hypothetical protein
MQERHDDAGGGQEHENVVEPVGVLQHRYPPVLLKLLAF